MFRDVSSAKICAMMRVLRPDPLRVALFAQAEVFIVNKENFR